MGQGGRTTTVIISNVVSGHHRSCFFPFCLLGVRQGRQVQGKASLIARLWHRPHQSHQSSSCSRRPSGERQAKRARRATEREEKKEVAVVVRREVFVPFVCCCASKGGEKKAKAEGAECVEV